MPLERIAAVPLSLSYQMSDNNGNKGGTGVNLPNGIGADDALTFATNLETALAALSNARIDAASVSLPFTQPATYTFVAPPESEIERKLLVTFSDATGRFKSVMSIPSPVFTLESAGTDIVPITNALIQDLATAVLTGPLGPGNGAVTAQGVDLTRILSAVIVHRARSRR